MGAMPTWDDARYLRFAEQRTRPARELLARVEPSEPERVVDLGCGPGNSTMLLAQRWPRAKILGVDSSEQMLARARADHPGIEFARGDIAQLPSEPVDVAFANASLQWVPGHAELLPRLLFTLRPGGALAFQVPCNFDEPTHRSMREPSPRWAGRFSALPAPANVQSAAWYYDLLAPLAASVDVWSTTYEHPMPSVEAIVEWVRGTGLRPYLEALAPDEREEYLADYTRSLDGAYPPRADGNCLLSFRRLFVVATRGHPGHRERGLGWPCGNR